MQQARLLQLKVFITIIIIIVKDQRSRFSFHVVTQNISSWDEFLQQKKSDLQNQDDEDAAVGHFILTQPSGVL